MRNGMKRTLKSKGTSRPPDAVGSSNSIPLLGALEDGIGAAGRITWNFFHEVPVQGAITSGAISLYAATVFGIAELVAAGLSGYVAYRMFAYGESLLEAIEKTIKFELGELSIKEIERRTRTKQTP
jgi:hypothetical protein